MVLQNTGRYHPDKANPFSAGTSTGVGGLEAGSVPVEDGKSDLRFQLMRENEAIDVKYGFQRINEKFGKEVTGYMMNFHSAEMLDENKRLIACIDLYFVEDDGGRFKVSVPFKPYFYIKVKENNLIQETSAYLSKRYGEYIHKMENVRKEDLDLPNHLVGLKQTYIKLSFLTTTDLQKVRKDILTAVRRNKDKQKSTTAYTELLESKIGQSNIRSNPMDNIVDIREHDLPLHVRAAIDKQVSKMGGTLVWGGGVNFRIQIGIINVHGRLFGTFETL